MLSNLFGTPQVIRCFQLLMKKQDMAILPSNFRLECGISNSNDISSFLIHAQKLGILKMAEETSRSKIYRVNKDSEIFKALVAFDQQTTELLNDHPDSGKEESNGKPRDLSGDKPGISLEASTPKENSSPILSSPVESGCKDCGLPMHAHYDDGACPEKKVPPICETCKGSGGIVVSSEDGPTSNVCPDCKGDGIAKKEMAVCQHCGLPMIEHDGSDFCPPGTEEAGGRR